ncbi:cytochrome C [Microvirga guangxiensis]|uniref:Cytochrome c n=1 Tax=Microvirga guangxiensis TaxID=549386 RepID=A0A1G5KLR8_9HYPH|nr:cytochrome C [Microvirga guangxiensis]SCZ00909.1 cytochrome c [Microvirga guangxiensis]
MNELPIPREIPLPQPAPEPVLVGVLIVFFLMHIVFVNLMVGGALLTLWYQLRGLKEKRYDDLAYAIASTITVNKSIAVVLGVGPLLAINTLYTVYFYSANALTGIFWISVIPLVTLAFLLTYLHKYLWRQMEPFKELHIGIAVVVCILFLFIPLIFLTNINLMLFPEHWDRVKGFFSALALPNVLPRYAHFILACPAMTGLLMVWLFRRKERRNSTVAGFKRDDLVRMGYRWAFWPTSVQFLVGPVVLMTLPRTQEVSHAAMAVFGIATVVALAMAHLMFTEIRRAGEAIGRSFGAICMMMLTVVALMGTGRHLYREAAVAPHRELVRAKTEQYMQAVDEARQQSARDQQSGGEAK